MALQGTAGLQVSFLKELPVGQQIPCSIFPPSWVLVLHQTQTLRAGAEQEGKHFHLTSFCSSRALKNPKFIQDLLAADAVLSQLLLH